MNLHDHMTYKFVSVIISNKKKIRFYYCNSDHRIKTNISNQLYLKYKTLFKINLIYSF